MSGAHLLNTAVSCWGIPVSIVALKLNSASEVRHHQSQTELVTCHSFNCWGAVQGCWSQDVVRWFIVMIEACYLCGLSIHMFGIFCVSLPKLGLTDPFWSFLVATLGEVPCASKVCQDVRPGRGLTTTWTSMMIHQKMIKNVETELKKRKQKDPHPPLTLEKCTVLGTHTYAQGPPH